MTPSEPGDETPKTVTEENPPENVLPFGAIGPESAPPQSSPPPTSTDRKAKNGWRVGKRSETSAVNGADGGRPLKKLDAQTLIDASKAVALGASAASARARFELTEGQAKWLHETAGISKEEWQERLLGEIEKALGLLAVKLSDSVNALEPREVAWAFGVLNDHRLKMRGMVTPATLNQTNIVINNVDRSMALAALTGARTTKVVEAAEDVVENASQDRLADAPNMQ